MLENQNNMPKFEFFERNEDLNKKEVDPKIEEKKEIK